jgi:peptidoglycan/LPS O-acetylase OafA/YrhL
MPVQSRFRVLDGWRGIAAVMVALYHLRMLGHFFTLAFVRNSWMFVDFFFVLSGFVISFAYLNHLHGPASIVAFLIRRFGRLWPLQIATLAAALLLALLKYTVLHTTSLASSNDLSEGSNQLSAIWSNVLLIQALGLHDNTTWNVPSWSISVEFWTYFVFAAVILLARRWFSILNVLLIILGAGLLAAFSNSGLNATYDFGFFRCIYGFFLGCLAFRMWSGTARLPHNLATILEIEVICVIILFVSRADQGDLSFAAPALFACAVWIFAYEAGAVSRAMKAEPFLRLGAWSYSIYMVHWLLFSLLHGLFQASQRFFGPLTTQTFDGERDVVVIFFSDRLHMDALAVAFIIAAVVVARFSHKLIEEPGRAYFNDLATRFTRRISVAHLISRTAR